MLIFSEIEAAAERGEQEVTLRPWVGSGAYTLVLASNLQRKVMIGVLRERGFQVRQTLMRNLHISWAEL